MIFESVFIVLSLIFHRTSSSDWNCTVYKTSVDEKTFFPLSNDPIYEQCTITVEYDHIHNENEKQVCTTHRLAITSLPPPSTSSNHTMQTFKLNSCHLSTLGQLPFSLPSSVQRLDLSSNILSTFTLSFPLPSNLKYLILDSNPNLIEIHFGSPRVQQRLIGLSLRHNQKMRLSSLPVHLTHLDLTDCNLSHSFLSTLLIPLTRLTHLSLADNQLERLPSIDERVQLQYLNLSNNRLIFIDKHWLHRSLAVLDLRHNRFNTVEFLSILHKSKSDHNNHPMNEENDDDNQTSIDHKLQLALYGNPLICDCWLSDLLHSSIVLTDYSDLHCNDRSIFDRSPDDFLCSYKTHCTADCTCCDFEACDCHSVCPSECVCSHDGEWRRHLVQCPRANLSSPHMLLPQTMTELDYTNNHIEEISPSLFIGKSFLKKIDLTRNHLKQITNDTFCAASNLQEMNLSENPSIRISLAQLDRMFACLNKLQYIVVSKEQIDEHETISNGWHILFHNISDQTFRLTRVGQQTKVSKVTTLPTHRVPRPSQLVTITFDSDENCPTCTSSTIQTVLQQHLPFLQYNQTLIMIVFFLLFFVLLFLMLLIILAICRRKLRRHLTSELQRQRSHHYYYHTRLHQPISKTTETNQTIGTNESLYEQLPSLSSDSELPFLYNDKKSTLRSSSIMPLAPPLPPTTSVNMAAGNASQHFCCHSSSARLVPGSTAHCHEYQYATNTASTTTGYSTPTGQPHQCAALFLWANRLLSPTGQTTYVRRPCRLHSSPSEMQHLQQYLLSNNQQDHTLTSKESNRIHCWNNEAMFVPNNNCHCRNHAQHTDTYIYPHVHR